MVALVHTVVAIGLWYLPVVEGILANADQEFGEIAKWDAVVAWPLLWLPLAAFNGNPFAAMPLVLAPIGLVTLFRRGEGVLACTLFVPSATTFGVLALLEMHVAARFVSFLLVPVLVLVSVAISQASSVRERQARIALSGLALVVTLLLATQMAALSVTAARQPAEAIREAVLASESQRPAAARIYVLTARPVTFQYYFGVNSRVAYVGSEHAQALRCGPLPGGAVFIDHPFATRPVGRACLIARGAVHHRLRQRTRGGRIDVWIVPPDRPGRNES